MRVPYTAVAGAVGLAAALSVLTGVGAAQAAVPGFRPTATEQANSAAIPAAASNNFDGDVYGHRGYGGQGGGAGGYGGRGRDYYGHRYYGHDPRQHGGRGWSSGN